VSRVIAIFGPTAVGKTAVAVELAKLFSARGKQAVAISADAMQVYRGLETLTGVASKEEQVRLEHKLVSFWPVEKEFSVGQYMKLAHEEIDQTLKAGKIPIVLGGTGLYLRAALTELDLKPQVDSMVRQHWEKVAAEEGSPAIHQELATRNPELAETVHPNDRKRIVRYLELLENKSDISEYRSDQLWTEQTRHPTLLVGLTMQRTLLREQIDRRVDEMVANGAAEEVRKAEVAGASKTARKALGYSELLTGDIERMKTKTKQYARRQVTWLRKLPQVTLIDTTGLRDVAIAKSIYEATGS